jgi:exopolysaccharide production protein ExoZ
VRAAGVDLFFVISGLVISLSTGAGDSLLVFSAKRFIRVVPLYWVATVAPITMSYRRWRQATTEHDVIYEVLFIPVHDFIPPYYPAWTLTFEMMFYVVFAVLLGTLRGDVTVIVRL